MSSLNKYDFCFFTTMKIIEPFSPYYQITSSTQKSGPLLLKLAEQMSNRNHLTRHAISSNERIFSTNACAVEQVMHLEENLRTQSIPYGDSIQ